MFKPAPLTFKLYLLASCSFMVFSAPITSFADEDNVDVVIADVENSTVIYDQDFIDQQSGMITVLDLINRIPGGSSFISNGNNGGNQRGFSNNDDPILINGQRISGKSNSSQDALGRLSVGQVLRIEVIRGSSPDIKISSQGALLNVVLREDAGGSGSWLARAHVVTGDVTGSLEGSYTDKIGFLDYTASINFFKFKNSPVFNERLFDASNVAIFDKTEVDGRNFEQLEISSNMTINLNNGEKINLNGQISFEDFEGIRNGSFLEPDILGDLIPSGTSIVNNNNGESSWEIGADYDTKISDNWELKLVALHSQENRDIIFGEDFDIENDIVVHDFEFTRDVFRSENVGRAALVWTPAPAHRLEFGSELAFNERTTDFELFNLEDDVLVRDNVASTLVTIKEVRDESFAIHSWQINQKLSLDSSLTYEYSKLTQSGNLDNERSFTFVKPSWDLRYNMSPKNQFQLSARKEVSQLNFGAFASSLNDDNEVVGGNSELEPQRSWVFEASYEHRLDDDNGFLKPTFFYRSFANKLNRIEVSPGISGRGNAGVGTRYGVEVEGALRFFFIGLPNMQLSGNFNYVKTEITDFFTGEKVPFNFNNTSPTGDLKLRHDMPEYGLLWEVDAVFNGDSEFRDLDEFSIFDNSSAVWVNVAAEKQIIGGLVLRVSYDNITNPGFDRERFFFENGRAGGVLTNREERVLKFNRQLFITLKGTF